MSERLKGKVAIITGGGRGIGFAIAKGYAAEGAIVCIADIVVEGSKRAAEEIGGDAFAVTVDVSRLDSIHAMVESVVKHAGGVDILVNGAGVFDLAPILDISEESYERVFTINVKGLIFTLQAAARQMVKQRRGGKIINFSSQAGRRGEPLVAIYCASKAAVNSVTQSAGLALIKHKINVNGIAPGVVDTPMWDKVDGLFAKYEGLAIGEKKKAVGQAVPFGRMGLPEDLVGAAIFLASAESDYVVAQTLNVDGGNWMS